MLQNGLWPANIDGVGYEKATGSWVEVEVELVVNSRSNHYDVHQKLRPFSYGVLICLITRT